MRRLAYPELVEFERMCSLNRAAEYQMRELGSIDDAVICANRRQQHRTRMTLTRGSVHHANLALISRMKPVPTQLLEHGTSIAS